MVEWTDLKHYEHVSIIIMHLPIKKHLVNVWTDLDKNYKWLKVMEDDLLETMHYNFLKFLGHVTIIDMHLPMEQLFK